MRLNLPEDLNKLNQIKAGDVIELYGVKMLFLIIGIKVSVVWLLST